MAQNQAKDELQTQPDKRFSFNAPYEKEQIYALRFTNESDKPVMWTLSHSCGDRLKMSSGNGILQPAEAVNVTVTMTSFELKPDMNDRYTLEWIVIPENGPKEFNMEYLQRRDVIKKKVIAIHYNL